MLSSALPGNVTGGAKGYLEVGRMAVAGPAGQGSAALVLVLEPGKPRALLKGEKKRDSSLSFFFLLSFFLILILYPYDCLTSSVWCDTLFMRRV